MKKIIILTLGIILFCCVTLMAQGTPGLSYTLINSGTAYSVSIGTATASHIEIPATYNGLPVTAITQNGFSNSIITSIYIPSSIISIREGEFSGCSNLEYIIVDPSNTFFRDEGNNLIRNANNELIAGTRYSTIPNSVTRIGNRAFYRRGSLISITIPNSVTSIGDRAFYECTSLSSVTIGSGLISIGDDAFHELYNGQYNPLQSVTYFSVDSNVAVGLFSRCSNLSTVVIGENVTNIGDQAFFYCTNLSSITIPNSVTSIGNNAFRFCASLSTITIPNSVTSIGTMAFENCTYLSSVTIENGLINIEGAAFRGCTSLSTITIPNSVTNIGDIAFNDCTNLSSVTIGSGLISIGNYVFSYYDNGQSRPLQSITYFSVDSNVAVGSLRGCRNLSTVIIGENVTSIPEYAFNTCYNLSSITIPNSVTSIGEMAFDLCTSLTSIEIPNSVTNIGHLAFSGCTSLTSINIPNSVTNIGERAFSGCTSLSSVTIGSGLISVGSGIFSNSVEYFSVNSNVAVGLFQATNYNYPNTALATVIIGPNVTNIENNAFFLCTNLSSIIIPNSVTSIGDQAFQLCTSLTSITIPISVTSIGDFAFSQSSLTSITIPNSVTSIGNGVFSLCTSLTSITIPNSVISIGYNAFNGCSSLSSITIPNSVTSIGDYAFYNCTDLLSVTIGSGLLSIGEYAFKSFIVNSGIQPLPSVTFFSVDSDVAVGSLGGCSNLSTVIIGENVTSISEGAFYNCSSLSSITISNSVTSIGDVAFGNCGNITSITIPNSVTSIGDYAFYNCTNLSSVTIGSGLISIGDYAFGACSSLISFTIPNSVNSIGDYAFYGCTGLTSLTIPNSVTSIGDYAFYNCTNLLSITIGSGLISLGENAFCATYNNQTRPLQSVTYFSVDSNVAVGIFLTQSGYPNNNLSTVIIGENVTSISEGAFHNCSSLSSITIPNSVTSIGAWAFDHTSLSSITIPNNVTSIGDCAFLSTNISSVTIGSGLISVGSQIFNSSVVYFSVDSNIAVGIFQGSNTYPNSVLSTVIIGSNVTNIPNYAFQYCTNLTSIEIPNSVTSIGYLAFNGSSLTSVTIPNSMTIIGDYAFSGCHLTSITIPNSVTTIGDHAFNGSNLTSINIPNSVTSIGNSTFYGCTSMTSIYIPNSVNSMGSNVFQSCYNLSIYAQAYNQPSGWASIWNPSNCPVYWGIQMGIIPPSNLTHSIILNDVSLSWDAAMGYNIQGYRVYRGNTQLTSAPISDLTYDAVNTPSGMHDFSVVAVYLEGASDPIETVAYVGFNPPSSLIATNEINSISLSWAAPTIQPTVLLSGYKIERRIGEDDWGVMADNIPTSPTLWSDIQVNNGIVYEYRVIAKYTNPIYESVPSNTANGSAIAPFLEPPTNLVASASDSVVNLTWEIPVRGLCGFIVYRNGAPLTQPIQTTYYPDSEVDNNQSYTYYVVAIYTDPEGISEPSNSSTIQVFFPARNIIATLVGYDVKLDWVSPEDISGVTGYRVYRDGDVLGFIEDNTYTDNSTEPGTTYFYQVKVVYGANESSAILVSIITPTYNPPNNLQATADEDIVILSWEVPNDLDLSFEVLIGYRIYRDELLLESLNADQTIYEDTDVVNGNAYTYTITALYADPYYESVHSNQESATPEINKIPPSNLDNNVSQNIVNLNWVAPISHYLLGYKILRSFDDGEPILLVELYDEVYYLDEVGQSGIFIYYVSAVYPNGESDVITTEAIVAVSEIDINDLILPTYLIGNYPNPFNPETTIQYSLPVASNLRVDIYNNKGQRVRTLIDREYPAGKHKVLWNGRDNNGQSVSSGIYFYKMVTGDYVSVKKMILLK